MALWLVKALLIILFVIPIFCGLLFAAAVIIKAQIKEEMKHGNPEKLHA